ncbi:MAG: thymidine phosphorylase [Bdellovibrionales bacterium]|nr:thymidine phosphorylase [Bdellovibrionales bacterium]
MRAAETIKWKRDRQELSLDQIRSFVDGYTEGSIPDYQMSALLMAIFLNGMTDKEAVHLTQVMLDSGASVSFSNNLVTVDKHSTGGVGDKASLILAPLAAACGVAIPMMSGRGLGHTGGTLDKLESIPGFQTQMSLDAFKKQVEDIGLCFIGQTKDICPADKKIYALRDVTGTVESLPLICASILSKKIAEGAKNLVLDVKMGSGAFMKTLENARALAKGLISIGSGKGLNVKAFITNMNQPLGTYIGNALEVKECLSILQQKDLDEDFCLKDFSDTQELSVKIAAQMVSMAKGLSFEHAEQEVISALTSGKAYEKFYQVCEAQGGDLDKLPHSSLLTTITASRTGYLHQIQTENVGLAAIALGAGRRVISDIIEPTAGLRLHKKIGDKVTSGEPLFSIYGKSSSSADGASSLLDSCYQISDHIPVHEPLIIEEI